ncbi:hypothetical protein NEOLEDRAFT_1245788 [Neolentinus lepideus HHB14362 ss-1]|uniref:Borealin N-terminal domain-containing protein n=1 Tax=Neolentinus lepideus HHB14362 ss-1 TaxID=1314782 RepID=A0A165NEC9_9AGAM|nr:hypothetical protein NEOLEDRAFT_1245788 [Neolentinus lepideus HHB14362 ss-1]
MEFPDSTRVYTKEEQAQLLANLDIELEHRTRQFKEWMEDHIQQFRIRSEGLISRLPKQLRNIAMAEFADKYNGDPQAAMIAMQGEKANAEMDEIAKSVRKRKWDMDVDGAEGSKHGQDPDSFRMHKNARLGFATPSKKAGTSNGPGTAQRLKTQMARTPNASRFKSFAPSPSPSKTTRFATATTTIPNGPLPRSRPASPSKSVAFGSSTPRVPSSSIFNPSMPPKTPVYPPAPRWPRKGEHLLSVNGSPLANPLWNGMNGHDKMEGPSNRPGFNGRGHKRVNSITILKNLSSRAGPSHSRTNSQAEKPISSSKPSSSSHNRTHTRTDSASSTSDHAPPTPAPARAFVSVPIRDGRVLQFDPLEASPTMLDELEGITESAKKQARDDMAKLVKAALDKWKLD